MNRPATSAANTGSASARLQAPGLELPDLAGNAYFVHHRAVESSIHFSGQLPFKDGELLGQGIVGRDVELERARELARHARTAIGVAGLPLNTPVENQMICTTV